jgi:low affinity Fe/Cu permease
MGRGQGVRRSVTVGTADRASLRRLSEGFRRFSQRTALAVGRPEAFALAVATVVVWAVVGPTFNYSDTWQLTINTGTTIITFLMVFLIQNTQNRDAQVMQLKLDELIRAVEQARNELVDMEDLSDEELHLLQHQFEALRKSAEATRSSRTSVAS